MANPVRDHSVISYTIPFSGKVSLKIYDSTGRLVTTLVDAVQPAGVKTLHWNTQSVSSGVYFFSLVANDNVATHKLILVK
jgi:flagellar hook assembly protein FlgD